MASQTETFSFDKDTYLAKVARMLDAAQAACDWLTLYDNGDCVWEEWPANDVLTFFHEAGIQPSKHITNKEE